MVFILNETGIVRIDFDWDWKFHVSLGKKKEKQIAVL